MKHSLSLSPKALTLSTGHTRILKVHAIYKVWDYQRGRLAGSWEDVEGIVWVSVWEKVLQNYRCPEVYLPQFHCSLSGWADVLRSLLLDPLPCKCWHLWVGFILNEGFMMCGLWPIGSTDWVAGHILKLRWLATTAIPIVWSMCSDISATWDILSHTEGGSIIVHPLQRFYFHVIHPCLSPWPPAALSTQTLMISSVVQIFPCVVTSSPWRLVTTHQKAAVNIPARPGQPANTRDVISCSRGSHSYLHG